MRDVSAVNYDPSVCYVLRFEVTERNPEIISVIFDGVGLEFSCRKISVCVSERGLDLAHERFKQGLVRAAEYDMVVADRVSEEVV